RKFSVDDFVNQTLFEGFQQRDQLRGASRGELACWLREALANNIRDAIRHLHRDKRDINREQPLYVGEDSSCITLLANLTDGLSTPASKALRQEREMQLAEALNHLPHNQRRAIELHHLQGCSLGETATEMGRTPASVAGLLRRGLNNLREFLQDSSVIES
ncbi:MAG: sigma-70 family RNA polymerase sigma factor, partial [Planctomycetaceae bacterium]|nr:sigma-70 family RNA polymerase sigma factor [Planctomycetaceae bacterium]